MRELGCAHFELDDVIVVLLRLSDELQLGLLRQGRIARRSRLVFIRRRRPRLLRSVLNLADDVLSQVIVEVVQHLATKLRVARLYLILAALHQLLEHVFPHLVHLVVNLDALYPQLYLSLMLFIHGDDAVSASIRGAPGEVSTSKELLPVMIVRIFEYFLVHPVSHGALLCLGLQSWRCESNQWLVVRFSSRTVDALWGMLQSLI